MQCNPKIVEADVQPQGRDSIVSSHEYFDPDHNNPQNTGQKVLNTHAIK